MYYVYEHYKKGTEKVFYVGIGNNIGKQQYSRAKSKIKRNPHWRNINNKYGFDFKIVFESDSRGDVCNKEIELISKYGRMDLGTGTLANMTTGGEKTFEMSQESIFSGVKKRMENGTYNKCAEIARQRMLNFNPWKGRTHDGFNNKKIYQYNAESGDFIDEYKSIRYATEKLKFSSEKIIGKCLSGENQTGGGYVWFYEYKGERIKRVRRGISKNQLKPIIELDIEGNVINEWECISDAASCLGVTSSAIGNGIKNNRRVKNRILIRKSEAN